MLSAVGRSGAGTESLWSKQQPLTFFQRGVVGTKKIWEAFTGWIEAFFRAIFCCQWGKREVAHSADSLRISVETADRPLPKQEEVSAPAGAPEEEDYQVIGPKMIYYAAKTLGNVVDRQRAVLCAWSAILLLIECLRKEEPLNESRMYQLIRDAMTIGMQEINQDAVEKMNLQSKFDLPQIFSVYNQQLPNGFLVGFQNVSGSISANGDEVDFADIGQMLDSIRRELLASEAQFKAVMIRIQDQNVISILVHKSEGNRYTYYLFNPHGNGGVHHHGSAAPLDHPACLVFESPAQLLHSIGDIAREWNRGESVIPRGALRCFNSDGNIRYEAWTVGVSQTVEEVDWSEVKWSLLLT